jgi:GNAT superfamily N-acetyltransferase
MSLQVRRASADDFLDVLRMYAAWQYAGEAQPDDAIFIARHGDRLIGVVRLVDEGGTTVLRGMRVEPEFQRQRVGTKLLDVAMAALGPHECYCIPYAHLIDFYGRAGFAAIAPGEAPRFLAERLERYRQRGPETGYLIMYRSGSGSSGNAAGSA